MHPENNLPSNAENARGSLARLRQLQDKESVREFYDNWSGTYDEHLKEGYGGPKIIADRLKSYLDGKTDPYILDVGAGSGLVGELLQESGFTNIVGIEPSNGMADRARAKHIYKEIFNEFFTDDMNHIESGTYDVLVCSGSIGAGHIQMSAIPEFARIVKPGGYVLIVTGKGGVEAKRNALADVVKGLERDGKWKCLEITDSSEYYYGRVGTFFAFKVNV